MRISRFAYGIPRPAVEKVDMIQICVDDHNRARRAFMSVLINNLYCLIRQFTKPRSLERYLVVR